MKCPLMPDESVLGFSEATRNALFLEIFVPRIEPGLGLSCPISLENYGTATEAEMQAHTL